MIGEVVRSRAAGRVAAILFFLIGIVCVLTSAAARSPNGAIFAILPFSLGLAAIITVDAPVVFEITQEGLAFDEPDVGLIRYDELCGLTAPPHRNPGEDFPIQVYYTAGVVRIPAALSVSSWELYEFLVDRLIPLNEADPENLPGSLRAFVAEQLALFGPEKVFVYLARQFLPLSSRTRHIGYAWGVVCAAGAWIAAGIGIEAAGFKNGGAWVGIGFLFLLLGLLFVLIFSRANARGRAANWRESCLVVSPGGIALVQGKLRGKMRWDELVAIEFPAKSHFAVSMHGGTRSGIGLLVEGAYFIIGDFYVRPLSQIHRSLRAYWGGRDAN